MSAPTFVPLVAYRNATPNEFFFSEVTRNGQLYDLTDRALACQVRAFPGAPGDPILTAQYGKGKGAFQLSFASMDAVPAPAEPGGSVVLYYDVRITDESGITEPWFAGTLTVLPGVTR